MAHVDLTTTALSVAGLGSARTYSMTSADPLTQVAFFTADAASAIASAGVQLLDGTPRPRPLVLKGTADSKLVTDGSTYVGYTLLRGSAPTLVWVDGAAAGAATNASLGGAGSTALSVAPAAAASPIAVGTNDPRVTTEEGPLAFGTDCSLAEQTIWTAPVACTVTFIYVETGSKAIAASNSNYVTLTANKRPLSLPGTPAAMVTTTTKAADLNATAAWTDKSLGTLANTSLLAGDKVTLTSATTGTITGGVAGSYRITYSVP